MENIFDTSGIFDTSITSSSGEPSTNPISSWLQGIFDNGAEQDAASAVVESSTSDLQNFLDTFNAPEITIDPETFIATDQDGNIVADYSHFKGQLAELQGMSVPTLDEWMSEQGLEFGTLDNLQALMDNLINDIGTIDEEEQQQALDYAAAAFGLDSPEFTALLGSLTTDLSSPETVQGFSAEQRAAYERANARDIANQYEYANRMVNNIMASTGSATRALAAADNYTNNINDYAIKSRTQLMEDDLAAQQANIQSKQQMWNTLVTTGQMAQSEYLERMMQSEATALQGYATQMQSILSENAQYLERNRADLAAIQTAADITYQGIMAELGVDAALTTAVQNHITNYYLNFNSELAYYQGQLDLAEGTLDDLEADQQQNVDNIFGVLGLVATMITAIAQLPI